MSNEKYNAIEILAYVHWDARGRPQAAAEEDWYAAERQFNVDRGHAEREAASQRRDARDEAVAESFPASDPPASQIADEPPSNADDKWEAAGVTRVEKV